MSEFTIFTMPKPVGFWNIGPGGAMGMKFSIYKKPTDAQIKNTEELLGWKWEDAND